MARARQGVLALLVYAHAAGAGGGDHQLPNHDSSGFGRHVCRVDPAVRLFGVRHVFAAPVHAHDSEVVG